MAMSPEEFKARFAAGASDQNTPELSPEAVKIIQQHLAQQGQQGWNLPIAPPKPDPEAAANRQIEAATPSPSAPSLKLNTSGQPTAADIRAPMPEMPDNPTDDDQSKMNKLMWLKQQAGQ